MNKNATPDDFEDEHTISKTQIKKEMQALQNLGVSLLDLSETQLNSLPLSDLTLKALDECRKIKSNSALKRQKQFIGKLMRKEDTETIQAQLDVIKNTQHKEIRQHHLIESWRDQLLEKGTNTHLENFINQYPQCDRQQLRQLVTKAQREVGRDAPPANTRKLFKFIRDTLNQQTDF